MTEIPQPYPESRWKHFKGGIYRVIGLAEHTETGECLVIYTDETSGHIWARPLRTWRETIMIGGESGIRFTSLDGAEPTKEHEEHA